MLPRPVSCTALTPHQNRWLNKPSPLGRLGGSPPWWGARGSPWNLSPHNQPAQHMAAVATAVDQHPGMYNNRWHEMLMAECDCIYYLHIQQWGWYELRPHHLPDSRGYSFTRINSAGALLAIRLLSDVFPQFIRRPSVSISTVAYSTVPESPFVQKSARIIKPRNFCRKYPEVSVNVRKCITSHTESWRIVSCLVIPVSNSIAFFYLSTY